jgi:hypothetical protein
MPMEANVAQEKRRRSKQRSATPNGEDTTAASPGQAPRRRASNRRTEVNQEVAAELRALRAALDEMVDRYRLRVGGRLTDLILLLEGDASIGAAAKPLATRDAQAMLEELREASIKPAKGRAKDFRRLEALVEDLSAEAEER